MTNAQRLIKELAAAVGRANETENAVKYYNEEPGNWGPDFLAAKKRDYDQALADLHTAAANLFDAKTGIPHQDLIELVAQIED